MEAQLASGLTPPLRSSLLGAQCLIWPATSSSSSSSSSTASPKLTLLFLPGNPGLADYYVAYLSALHQTVAPHTPFEIICVSQLGHDPASAGFDLEAEPVVSLQRQIEHKEAILSPLSSRSSSSGSSKILLAGHSIGAYMALEIVRRGKVPNIDSLHLLFPALHEMARTPNAQRLRLLLRAAAVSSSFSPANVSSKQSQNQSAATALISWLLAGALSTIALLLTLVPFFLVKFLILLVSPTQGPDAIRATAGLLASRRAVRQCLGMACEEMDTVRNIDALNDESGGGPKIRAYWAAGDVDGWAPQSSRIFVEQALALHPHRDSTQLGNEEGGLANTLVHKRQKSFSIDEIRQARRSRGKSQRLAKLVRAGASAGLAAARFGASYGLSSTSASGSASTSKTGAGASPGSVRRRANNGSNGTRPPPVSPTRTRTIKRRPSLVAARASRRFDGSIYIEPDEVQPEGRDTDLLANDNCSSDEDEDTTLTTTSPTAIKSIQNENNGAKNGGMPHRASMVCNVGMPHAFVLEHSEQMARITAQWILDDYGLIASSPL